MESKTVLKTLLEKTVKANFEGVHRYLKDHKTELDESTAIKFIVACCNACNNNLATPQNLNEWDLVNLVKCLLNFIKTPLSDNCDCYLQSVFYIMKLLIEKNCFDCIAHLENLFMPEFMPLVFTEKQLRIHLSICKSLYNVIVKTANAKEEKYKNSVLKLCYLLSALYQKTHNVSKLIESVHNCTISLATLNVEPGDLLKFYHHFLDLVDYSKEAQFFDLLINNFSFLYTHLLKVEKFDLGEACYSKTVEKMQKLYRGKVYKFLYDILEMARWINPINCDLIAIPTKAHNSLKNYYRIYKSTANLQAICDLISSVAFTVLQYYKTNSSEWVDKSVELHSEYYRFLNDISHIMAQTPYKCHCKECPTKTNLNEASRTSNTIAGLSRLVITKRPEISRSYKMDMLRYFDKYIEHIATMKANSCVKWRSYWSQIGGHLYTLGLTSLRNKDVEMCVSFLKRFVQVLLEFEGLTPEIVEKNYLIGALGTISDAYMESKDYERCLLTTAFNIMINGAPKNEIHRWIKAKVACRESTILENGQIQELTLLSVCRKFEEEVAFYDPKKRFGVDKQKQIELLQYELKNYKWKWKSKVPMMSVYRELTDIADSSVLARVFIETWGDCDLQVHDSIPKLLQDTIKRLEVDTAVNRNDQSKYQLAHLYFLQHKYRVKDTIIRHCDEMERTMMNMTKTTNENEPIPPDPNEECDIVSSYDCLKLTKYLQMMKELNKSLELISELFPNFEKCDKEKIFKLLAKIGHEYNLHSHSTRSLQAWELALKIAEVENNRLYILQAVSFILELSDVTKASVAKLVAEAEQIADFYFAERINLEELIIYYLCKSEAYFYANFDIAYAAFRQALKLHQEFQGGSLLKARMQFLHHKFVMLPCKYQVEGHREHSLVKIHLAHNYAIKHYTENTSDSAYEMRVFFEIHEALVKMYHDMRLPREVRCYCKEVVVVAQKMVLPIRTISCLYYLAGADISSCRLDDCRVKIVGFSDILGLSKCKTVAKNQFSRPKREKFDKIVDNLVSEFNEMMLDVPAKVSRPTSAGSPSLGVETFNVPGFLNHEDNCECFYCTCLEYHQFVLKKTYLHALLYEHENNIAVAKEFFCGCIKIYEYFKSKQDIYLKKIAKRVSSDLVPTPQSRFVETYCLILFEYANFSLRSGRVKDADRINKKLLQTLESFYLQSIYLHNEVLAQRLNILSEKLPRRRSSTRTSSVSEDLNTAIIEKTPESKHSKVLISPESNSQYLEIPKMKPKSLRFDDDEEENAEVKVTVPKNLPPFLNMAAKTPAPSSSKIKIYTNKSTKKKKVLVDIPPQKKDSNVRTSEFLVPMSPEAYTPSSLKGASRIDSALANRTKLLTSRLKNSTRKGENVPSIVINDENSEGCSSKSEDRRAKSSVRQNLLSQLEGSEDGARNGALRKSARNRR
ncbi:uncharacterized protein BDFB_009305 [Asbolus verrucosus]|uniref:Uncharacterized protein n=1 Tax=Asbolus verrucosus TaxID=1661398 RepID=A0A482W1H9_ASBVE|nr:uncharacterized protein BDFB_009305 [Asbolus verrucosus]